MVSTYRRWLGAYEILIRNTLTRTASHITIFSNKVASSSLHFYLPRRKHCANEMERERFEHKSRLVFALGKSWSHSKMSAPTNELRVNVLTLQSYFCFHYYGFFFYSLFNITCKRWLVKRSFHSDTRQSIEITPKSLNDLITFCWAAVSYALSLPSDFRTVTSAKYFVSFTFWNV